MLLYQRHHRSITIATRTSYWFQSDIIGMPFCQGTISTKFGYSLVALVTDVCYHLTYDSRGAWHSVYAMLLLNYKWDTTWNSYNPKVWFSQIYNSYSNTLKCLSIGTPKNNKFSICPKWKIHYFQVSQNLGRVQPHYNVLDYWDT